MLTFQRIRYEKLYLVYFSLTKVAANTCLLTKSSKGWLWHCRLAHISMGQIKKLMKKKLAEGLKDITFKKDKLCSECQARKQVV